MRDRLPARMGYGQAVRGRIMSARLAFNILAICGAATFTGVMLSIGLILGAYWKGLPSSDFLDWFSENNHLIARTIPFFAVPALLGLAVSAWFDWSEPQKRMLWLAALACAAGIGIITFAFHLPTNGMFAAKTVSLADVPAKLDQWLLLHWLRIALGLTAAVLGVVAVSR
jgi:uncharacterized membrane protein